MEIDRKLSPERFNDLLKDLPIIQARLKSAVRKEQNWGFKPDSLAPETMPLSTILDHLLNETHF